MPDAFDYLCRCCCGDVPQPPDLQGLPVRTVRRPWTAPERSPCGGEWMREPMLARLGQVRLRRVKKVEPPIVAAAA